MEHRQFASLEGPFAPSPARGADEAILILLHGWGADGHDLIDLAGPLQAQLPYLHLFTPHAPAPCTANPMGRQWFELTERIFEKPASAVAEIDEVSLVINKMIEVVSASLSIARHKIILGGFSQGGMITLNLASLSAADNEKQLGGYASIAGALIAPNNVKPAGDAPAPIWLAHGKLDQVVPFVALEKAQQQFATKGYDVSVCVRDLMGHSIDMPTLESLIKFVKNTTSA